MAGLIGMVSPELAMVLNFSTCTSVWYVSQRFLELAKGHGYDEFITGEVGYSFPGVVGYEVYVYFTCN